MIFVRMLPIYTISITSFPRQLFGVFMQFKVKSALTVVAGAVLLVACGKKEEPAPAPAAAPKATTRRKARA